MKVTPSPGRTKVCGFFVRSVIPLRVRRTFPSEINLAAPVRVFCKRVRKSQTSNRQDSSSGEASGNFCDVER